MSRLAAVSIATVVTLSIVVGAHEKERLNQLIFHDQAGEFSTIAAAPTFEKNNPFFQSLGTNGRSCNSCHQASDAWTITPEHIQERFRMTRGRDPLFRTNDGSNCEGADVSTFSKAKEAYSLLLNKGLIRVELPVPANAEFAVLSTDDPYGCTSTPGTLSLYRRVLPATNLRFLSTVMWDGRENTVDQSVLQDLAQQAIDATTGHAQASTPPTQQQIAAIVAFETATYTAQIADRRAGRLDKSGGLGGALHLSRQPFFIGINDPLGNNPQGLSFDPKAFTSFAQFGLSDDDRSFGEECERRRARESIRRGEAIFNTKSFTIDNVAGLPSTSLKGNCTLCHDTPNVGDHSVAAPLNIGLADASQRTPDLPLYTLYCFSTQETIQTTDPGRAMITGKCADIGKFKGPTLRALAARPPYFHNGSAATLNDVVNFYNTRFHIGFSEREKADLIAFLKSL
jgi:cytochrome c peroxidase